MPPEPGAASRFSLPGLADVVMDGLEAAARALDDEQAAHGVDSFAELDVHPLLRGALLDAGYGVFPEERYPHARARARRSSGRRCDLVLTRDAAPLEDVEEALFLEVKIAAEHVHLGRSARYGRVLGRDALEDVVKLCSDGGIHHAALLLVLFTGDAATATRDVTRASGLFLDEGLPVGVPYLRSRPLRDRAGNGAATCALFPVGTLRRGLFP